MKRNIQKEVHQIREPWCKWKQHHLYLLKFKFHSHAFLIAG
jgi:hypothetical protein